MGVLGKSSQAAADICFDVGSREYGVLYQNAGVSAAPFSFRAEKRVVCQGLKGMANPCLDAHTCGTTSVSLLGGNPQSVIKTLEERGSVPSY